jgi:hypothetical protein
VLVLALGLPHRGEQAGTHLCACMLHTCMQVLELRVCEHACKHELWAGGACAGGSKLYVAPKPGFRYQSVALELDGHLQVCGCTCACTCTCTCTCACTCTCTCAWAMHGMCGRLDHGVHSITHAPWVRRVGRHARRSPSARGRARGISRRAPWLACARAAPPASRLRVAQRSPAQPSVAQRGCAWLSVAQWPGGPACLWLVGRLPLCVPAGAPARGRR